MGMIIKGEDNFLYKKSGLPSLDNEKKNDGINNVQKHMDRVLSGHFPEATEKALRYKSKLSINDVTARLLKHHGIHPGIALVMAEIIAENSGGLFSISLSEDMEETVMHTSSDNPFWFVKIGQEWRWSSQYTLKGPDLPESIINNLLGKKLKSVIQHPVLDQVNLTIKEVRRPKVISGHEMKRKLLGDPGTRIELLFHEEEVIYSPLGITALFQTENRIKAKFG
jgi:hypothetical protein